MTKKQKALSLLQARSLDTREKALDARVELDVARWGEQEREASRRMHRRLSHALLLNSIAVFDVAAIDEELHEAARALMTSDDRAWLRSGG